MEIAIYYQEEGSMNLNSDNIDRALTIFNEININSISGDEWNESSTRLKIIDSILFEVLGWNKNESKPGEKAGDGFTDYSLKIDNLTKVVVEAKKKTKSFDLENRVSGRAYKLNGSCFNPEAKKAINQAIGYSAFNGAELACITNGTEWIIFRANRLATGENILEGKAFVFNSIDGIKQEFRKFYDLLSLDSVSNLKFRGEFQVAEGGPVRDLSYFEAPKDPDSKRLLNRGKFATDFDMIMSEFFERLNIDKDPDMTARCFVESPESELADQKLLRISSDLIEKVKSLNSQGEQLVRLIEKVKVTNQHNFVLLVGNKGAGKSTFIKRFFRYVLPEETSSYVKTFRVDLAKSSGEPGQIVDWLNRELLEKLEKSVTTSDNADSGWNEIIGKIFFDDYQRWSTKTMVELYESNRSQFRIEFGRHIENIREERPNEYIRRLIAFLTKSSLKIPCIIFDNTDHFSIEFQEAVFQFARAIYERELCIIIMPVTDKTSWQLSKQGAFQSFESESLFLPVPKPEKILKRRITYLEEKLIESSSNSKNNYFLGKGIKLHLNNIAGFVTSINQVFLETPRISEWLGGLVNDDIRRLLEFTRETIASPHLNLDDLVKAHFAGSAIFIPRYKIKNAIIKKRYNIYPVGEHSFVQNVFSDSFNNETTPLLSLRIIQFLSDSTSEFMSVSNIYNYFLNFEISQSSTRVCLAELLKTGLILNFDPTVKDLNSDCKLEASPSGIVHLDWATTDQDYIGIMKDITFMRKKEVVDTIRKSFKDYRNCWAISIKAFIDYLIEEDTLYCKIPNHSSFERQQNITTRLQNISDELKEKSKL
ncbi:MAG: AAA family ATPase [Rhodobacteraceae bacterium]|nr:AAA family ATPase [Paracoccaceae bacterium]